MAAELRAWRNAVGASAKSRLHDVRIVRTKLSRDQRDGEENCRLTGAGALDGATSQTSM
jgi:hypothetical protein